MPLPTKRARRAALTRINRLLVFAISIPAWSGLHPNAKRYVEDALDSLNRALSLQADYAALDGRKGW